MDESYLILYVITTALLKPTRNLWLLSVFLEVYHSFNNTCVYECDIQVSACVRVSLIVKSSGDAGLIKIDEECPMSWLG